MLDTGDMPQGSNSERCSARLQIAEPSRWKSCKYRKRTILVNVVRDCYDPRRMGTYVLRFLRADDICDTIPAGWRHVLRSLQAKEMCYNSCRLTTYVLRALQADDICGTIHVGWRHMCYDPWRLRTYVYSSKEEIRIVPVTKDYICRSF